MQKIEHQNDVLFKILKYFIKKLLEKNIPLEDIIEITGLSKEEIESIK